MVTGEDSSGDSQEHLGITKAGNTHVRRLLIETDQSYGRGVVGGKSVALKARRLVIKHEVIAYADMGNERLRRQYYKMIFAGKKVNVVKTAIARELACFKWRMMTGRIA